jgi:hypothetical protein
MRYECVDESVAEAGAEQLEFWRQVDDAAPGGVDVDFDRVYDPISLSVLGLDRHVEDDGRK